jgi:transposase InsO family protein
MYAAVRKYGVPEVLVSDNGSIFTSHDTRRLCEQLGIAKQEIKKGCPYQSPQIESWERSEVECFKDGEPCFTSRRLAAMRCRSAGLPVSGGSSLPLDDREMKWASEEQWNESSEAHFSPLGFVQFAILSAC